LMPPRRGGDWIAVDFSASRLSLKRIWRRT
jgi:hypothetical protein